MEAWCWCPYCQRAFEGEVAPSSDGAEDALVVLTNCPFDGCAGGAPRMMAWSMVRKWAEIFYAADFPAIPVRGEFYELPLVALDDLARPRVAAVATAVAAG
jgi:hypothetical protein